MLRGRFGKGNVNCHSRRPAPNDRQFKFIQRLILKRYEMPMKLRDKRSRGLVNGPER